MAAKLLLAALAALATLSTAQAADCYKNNCEGSSFFPKLSNCQAALGNIDVNQRWATGSEFSSGDCYMKYVGGHDGEYSLPGNTIRDTAQKIMDECGKGFGGGLTGHGSYGTCDCADCHVTVNYRA